MSSAAVPVPPFEFVQQGDLTDNFTYTVPASGEVQPYTSTATFVNASGQAIQPTISIYSAEGNLLARVFPVTALADGGTAEVTWMPPFGSAASSSSSGGSDIQFDTEPQPGGWLDYETTAQDGNGYGSTINNAFGSKYVSGPDASGAGNFTIETYQQLDSAGGSGNGASALYVDASNQATDGSPTLAAEIVGGAVSDVDSAGLLVGANASTDNLGDGNALGVEAQVNALNGDARAFLGVAQTRGLGQALGADVTAHATGSGNAVGLAASASVVGGSGTAYPIQGFVGSTLVFRFDSDGTIHVPTGASTALIADLQDA